MMAISMPHSAHALRSTPRAPPFSAIDCDVVSKNARFRFTLDRVTDFERKTNPWCLSHEGHVADTVQWPT
jgi:hypothetical protein